MKNTTYFFSLILLVFISCEKKDEPYVLPPPGDVEMSQVSMGENYDTQIYFTFKDKKQVTNHLYNWDLEFETGPDAFLVRENGGKQVQVFNTNETEFSNTYSVAGINWQWDSPDGNPDSVAFRNWNNTSGTNTGHAIYLIDRGPDVSVDRYKKMQLTEVNAVHYKFKYANPDGSELREFTLLKDTNSNYVFFSFQNGGMQVNIEPPKITYDILFTRYRYIYYDLLPPLAYTVNGALINPYLTSVAADSVTPFDSIDFDFAKTMVFSTKFDAIGFDWKTYDFTNSVYAVNSKKCYVIKNNEGILYKLRFIDFYNSQGIKGSPKFEFQRL